MDSITTLKRAYSIREKAHKYFNTYAWSRLVHSEVRRYSEDTCYVVFWVGEGREWSVNVSSCITTTDAEGMTADTLKDMARTVDKAIRDALNEL